MERTAYILTALVQDLLNNFLDLNKNTMDKLPAGDLL